MALTMRPSPWDDLGVFASLEEVEDDVEGIFLGVGPSMVCVFPDPVAPSWKSKISLINHLQDNEKELTSKHGGIHSIL